MLVVKKAVRPDGGTDRWNEPSDRGEEKLYGREGMVLAQTDLRQRGESTAEWGQVPRTGDSLSICSHSSTALV